MEEADGAIPVQDAVERALARSLHLLFGVSGLVYLAIAVSNAIASDAHAERVRGVDALTSVLMFSIAIWLYTRRWPPRQVPAWVTLLAFVTLTTGGIGLLRNPYPSDTLTLELTALVTGFLLMRSRLYAALTAYAFFLLGAAIVASDAPGNWFAPFARVVGFTGAGWFLHVGRLRQLGRLESLRVENQSRAVALDASEQRFRTLAENARDLVSVIDPSGRFVYVSPRSREMLGYGPEELVGQPLDLLVSSEDQVVANDRVPGWWNGSDDTITFRCRRKDGTIVVHDVSARPISRPEGPCLVLTSRDVTERHALEDRLRDAQKHESLSLMAGGIAHDFNNLLTVVLGEAELARGLEAGQVEGSLDRIVESVERAQRLTGQLLAYAGGMPRQEREFDLGAEVEGVVDLLRSSIPAQAELVFDFDPTPPVVRADPSQVQQLILNLVLNAAESRSAGPVRVTIRVRSETLDARAASALMPLGPRAAGRYAVFVVEDDGDGIAPEQIGRVFDPFFTTKRSGRGLGLAAALGVVRAHGAGLCVESQPGKGSCFTAYFPALEHAASQLVSEASPPRPSLGPGRVLVVDDESGVRRVIARSLRALGLEPQVASCGEEAVEIVRDDRSGFRLAAVDLSMPGIDGIETRRQLLALCPDLPVLLMSGFDRPGVLGATDGQGMRFLRKPFTQAQLADCVRELLGPSE